MTFMLKYKYTAYQPGIKARVQGISKGTVISTLKKASALVWVNPQYAPSVDEPLAVRIEAAEMDEQM